ncbi:MAG: hypothetical protein GY797_34445 [Deltaproteobacteria bacterium]|nr:hypothetical protein [Deltaproteobacteria bacterium]
MSKDELLEIFQSNVNSSNSSTTLSTETDVENLKDSIKQLVGEHFKESDDNFVNNLAHNISEFVIKAVREHHLDKSIECNNVTFPNL